jgi:hypothetical protein
VYLTWVDIDTSNGQKQVFFRASNDNGQTFGSPIMPNSTTTGPKETSAKKNMLEPTHLCRYIPV